MMNELKLLPLEPDELDWLRKLADLAGWPEQELPRRLVQAGLNALRLEAAMKLYSSRPLSTGQIAEMVGLNRGDILREFIYRGVEPYDDPDEDESEVERRSNMNASKLVKMWPQAGAGPK